MAVATTDGTLQALAERFRLEADARDVAASNALTTAWAGVYGKVRDDMDRLAVRIAKAREDGIPTSPAWALRQASLGAILANAGTELDKFAATADQVTRKAQADAINAAREQAARLADVAAGGSGAPGLVGALGTNPANVQAAVGFLADGSPLASLFGGLGDTAVADARRVLTTGLALGKHPDWMRRRFLQTMDLTASRAQTIARTETLRVYRQTTLDEFQANPVVGDWAWRAKLDNRTCPACVVMHGSVHSTDERLDGHPNCRCAMIPRTPSWADILGEDAARGIKDTRVDLGDSGAEWFGKQSAVVQRGILGPAKFSAYRQGKISLDDVVARPSNKRWGSMRRERSLAEIRAGKNANSPVAYARDQAPPPLPTLAPQAAAAARPVPPAPPAATERLAPASPAPAPVGVTGAKVYAKKRKPTMTLPNRSMADTPRARAAWDTYDDATRTWQDATAQSIQHRQALENERARLRAVYPDAQQRARVARQDPRMQEISKAAKRAVEIEDAAWEAREDAARALVRADLPPTDLQPRGVKPERPEDLTTANTADWTDEDFMEVMGQSWDDPALMARLEAIIEDRETNGIPDLPPAPADALAAQASPAVDPFTGKPYATTEARAPRKLSKAERLEEDHQGYVNASYQRAMDETNGVMLNELGRRMGVSDFQLFVTNAATARKYASEELISYWEKYGRHSKQSFDYMMNQTPSARKAFEATRRAGFGGPSGRDKDRA